ncbi:MAG: ribokinase [Rhodospirillaceae bacterium]|nr:ribokinase [Rhodospirillaceae bacterium]|tara:strand:+ start:3612 stop:4544 length:933 start_codon:yes stop_codon:yes gene_type:complete
MKENIEAKGSPKRLISLGACTVDVILSVETIPSLDAKVMAQDGVVVGAGMAVAAAATAAVLGGIVSIWGRIGDDLLGDFFLADLAGVGVETAFIRRVVGAKTGLSSVIVDSTGKRLIVPYYDPVLGADASWLPITELEKTDCILSDVRWPEGSFRLMTEASKRGLIRIFDGDVAQPEVLKALAPLSTHAIFSEPGFSLFSGRTDLRAALLDCASRFDGCMGVTVGEEGFIWVEDGHVKQVLPPKIIPIDTLAAGDVFHGAFGLAVAEGMQIRSAAEFACAAAAIKCTRFGGRAGIPERKEVQQLVEKTYR